MKVCDVVMNSIWYDPRVRKQIVEYLKKNDLYCVGLKCFRYDEQKIKEMPCRVYIASIDEGLNKKQTSILKKLKREKARIIAVRDAILKEKPDLIHANDLDALIPAYLASKKLKCRLVYDSHEICVENHMYSDKKLFKFIMRLYEKHIIRKKVDLMVCVSNAAADYFEKKYKIKRPMVVTNCALKKEIIIDGITKNDQFEILNHGQFYEGRGYELMAESCSLLKDYPEIVLALRGFGKLEKKLKEKIKEGNFNNFKFYPPVTVQELIPMAAKSHVGVAITEPICLNFKLSVSNKLFEYAAAGLPVIMSDIPEHRYLNDKYQFGIIIKENTPECFVQAVKKLYLDKEFYGQCVENAKKMSQEINWETDFAKLIQAEKELVYGKK